MPVDTSIYNLLQPVKSPLLDVGKLFQQGQQLRGGQLELAELQRQQQEAEAIRQAYAQQYGGGGAPPGLAGAQPMQPPGPEAPVQERQLGGSPSANAPYATPPPGGPQAPQGLAGVQPMTKADSQGQRAFIDKLYSISPKAGREAENHAFTSQKQQYEANKERVEYLGRVANGVLDSPNPQQAWTVARAMLIEAGMPPGQAPEVYDPNYVQQLSGMALDAKDKYNAGILRLQQDKEQRERNETLAKVPNYGLDKDANAVMHEMFGAQIPPGSAPTPAMTQRVNAELIRRGLHVEEEKAIIGAGAKAPAEVAQREKELRGEFRDLTKDYRTVSDAYGRIQSSAKDPSAAGDLALIFSYMKLLDPGSTVREGEYATAASAGSVPERLIGQYNRLLTGERLSENVKADFVDRSARLYDQSTKDYEKKKTQYEGLTQRYGGDPANVTLDFSTTAERTAPRAAPGGPTAQAGKALIPMTEAMIADAMQQTQKSRAEVIALARKTGKYQVPEQ